SARWQIGGFGAEILLIEIERRQAVEIEQRIAARAGDDAVRTDRIPAADAAMADPDLVAIKADRAHAAGLGIGVEADAGGLEGGAVPGEAAGQANLAAEHVLDAADQFCTIDAGAIREDEDIAQPLRRQRRAEARTDLERATAGHGDID